jgi:hypothetical protein
MRGGARGKCDVDTRTRSIETQNQGASRLNPSRLCEHLFVTAQGSAYSQFKRALERRNFMLAWTMAAELPKVPLADGLELLLLARALEPARFDRAVPRWHARLCSEHRLSSGEAQLALAALNALPGPGVEAAVQSLAALCDAHGLRQAVRVLETWLAARATAP